MRFQGKSRLGFYPLPFSEAQRIRRFLLFPDESTSALDPCVGDGAAFEVITSGAEVFRYGIELDAYRAEQSKQRIQNVIQGNALDVQCAVECFGLQFLNPPYDYTLGPGATICSPCSDGFYSQPGASFCSACSPGSSYSVLSDESVNYVLQASIILKASLVYPVSLVRYQLLPELYSVLPACLDRLMLQM